ncbi:MAG: DNA-processing protein DprA [Limnochordia bacterium]|jgi:DNA processing protein
MSKEERLGWIGLNMVPGLGPRRIRRLVDCFQGAKEAWQAPEYLLAKVLGPRLARHVVRHQSRLNPAQELEEALNQGFHILTPLCPDYPPLLKTLPDAPAVLYCWGEIPQGAAVALVGTRQPSPAGQAIANRLGFELAKHVAVVSGLARGIDGLAHRGALHGGGATWAVLGSALDRLYPPEHADLAQRIVSQRGAILSEYPLGTGPRRGHFPARNRIISGLALAVVVVEAPTRSGALITADFALEQGREVLAVPGSPINPQCQGSNLLIQQGAKLVQQASDILEEINALPLPALMRIDSLS